uniref:Protein kinase domain-containing protein n=1 Tax=Heterorhabditis bacteriophora TaxID=37862 RepID=A0A1I7XT57_HETBA
MDHIDEYRRLEEFKSEVAAHKNTRHDNIVLFLGYCLEQDKLGIVMSLCKGRPLYQVLHESNEKLDLSTSLLLATQICQGVSYLHTKKILHKDLRSKNIFIESKNKVVITDFGLFSMKRLRNPHRMAHKIAATLPRINATIGHVPQKLKTAGIEPTHRARLEVIVPRFVEREGPYTSIFRLPSQRLQQYIQNKHEYWKRYDIAVLEIDG